MAQVNKNCSDKREKEMKNSLHKKMHEWMNGRKQRFEVTMTSYGCINNIDAN